MWEESGGSQSLEIEDEGENDSKEKQTGMGVKGGHEVIWRYEG